MRKITLLQLIIACLIISGCSSNKIVETLRYSKKAPDEFQVVSYKPLSSPEDFELVAPKDKQVINSREAIREEAKKALFHKKQLSAPHIPSSAESSLLTLAGTKESNIRSLIADDNVRIKEQRLRHLGALGELISWSQPKDNNLLNPEEEQKRLSKFLQKAEASNPTSSPSF